MQEYDENYLLDKKIKIYQPKNGYRASSDAVWIAAAVEKVKDGDKILDVGSGTGAISLCLAERFKDKKTIINGIERQEILAKGANKSAEDNGFENVEFFNENIFDTKLNFCSFNHVISNPPYAKDDMPSPNESKAFAHNFSEFDLEKWIDFCIKMLKPQGKFYMINRAEALDSILSSIYKRLGKIEIFPLYSKKGQKAKRVIVTAQKDFKTPLVIHSGVIIHQENGEYTPYAEEILREGKSLLSIDI